MKMNERHLPCHSYGRWWCPAVYPCSKTWQWSQCLFSTTFRIAGKGWGASGTSFKAAESAFRRRWGISKSKRECFTTVRCCKCSNPLPLAIVKSAAPPPASVTPSPLAITASLASAGSRRFRMHVFFRLQGGIWILSALTPGIRWLDRRHCASVFLRQALLMETRHCLVSSSRVWWSHMYWTGLMTHPMRDSLHVGLQQALSFESGVHEPADAFQVSNVPGGCNGPLTYSDSTCPWRQTHRSLALLRKHDRLWHLYLPSKRLDLGREIHMAFIRNGIKLAHCAPDFVLRIWDIAGLIN